MINFDNAATTGRKPQNVINAVKRAMYDYSANPGRGGHNLSVKAAQAVYDAREKIAGYFGASGAENVIFTANCTAAINYVIKGVLKTGDHIIISDLEHNAVIRPLQKTGVSKSIAEVSLFDDKKTVENFEKEIRDDTKMIFCTAASNVCGKMLPIKALGSLCKKRGILFGVDAAQMAGVLPIDMKEMNIDFLCIAPHKGLYAPMGIGVLIAEKNIGDTLIEGGTGTFSQSPYQPKELPERYESGTLNVPAIMGVSAGIDFVKSKTSGAYSREMHLIGRLYNHIKNMPHIELYTPYMNEYMYMPVLSINVAGVQSEKVAAYLNSNGIAVRAGLHCAPAAHIKLKTINTGTVRIAPSYFTTSDEINYLLDTLKYRKVAKKLLND